MLEIYSVHVFVSVICTLHDFVKDFQFYNCLSNTKYNISTFLPALTYVYADDNNSFGLRPKYISFTPCVRNIFSSCVICTLHAHGRNPRSDPQNGRITDKQRRRRNFCTFLNFFTAELIRQTKRYDEKFVHYEWIW